MYVVNITRKSNDNDVLCGNDSMDAKSKTINYIMDYALANYNLFINRDLLDQNLDTSLFSFKSFLRKNYSISTNDDLIIQGVHTDKNHCIFVKFFNERIDDFPTIYTVGKHDLNKARNIMAYIVNDELIKKFPDDLDSFEKNRVSFNDKNIYSYSYEGVNCNIISLYKNGLFLEELLNNNCSLNQLERDVSRRYDI